MKRILFILFLTSLISSIFALDFYTIKDKEDENYAYIYSPRKEKKSKGWQFFEKGLNFDNPKLYKNPTRSYWRLKINFSELPYKYIERKSSELTIAKNGSLELNIGNNKIKVNLKGFITPRSTGHFYYYQIKNKLKNLGVIKGQAIGKRIGKRVHFSIFVEIHNDQGDKTIVNGSFTVGLSEPTQNGQLEGGMLTFFARIEPKKGPKSYIRITGKIKGSLEKASLLANMIDVNGKSIGKIKGDLQSLDKLLLIKRSIVNQ